MHIQIEKYISFRGFTPEENGLLLISTVVSVIVSLMFSSLKDNQVASYVTGDKTEFVYKYKNWFFTRYTKRPVSGGTEKSIKKSDFKILESNLIQRVIP